jgi:hypothetical protein
MSKPLESLLEDLIGSGVIPDADKAQRRLRLGYPSWLVLDDLDTQVVTAVLSRVSGIPVLGKPLTSDLLKLGSPEFYDRTVLKARRWAPLSGPATHRPLEEAAITPTQTSGPTDKRKGD